MAGPQAPPCALGLFPPQLPGGSPPGREEGYREKFQIHQCLVAEREKVRLTHGPGCNCRVVSEPEMGPPGDRSPLRAHGGWGAGEDGVGTSQPPFFAVHPLGARQSSRHLVRTLSLIHI